MAPSLLEIAPELRNMIWEVAVHEVEPIPITHFEPFMGALHTEVDLHDAPPTDKRTAFHFTQSNQQINNEAAAMYYRSNTFRYVVADRGYVRLRAWVEMIGRLPRVKGNSVNNGPHLEIELLGWVHSYNSVTVPRIRLTKFFGRLCFVLARAGFLKGTVNITLAGYGSTFAPRRGPPLATSQAAVRHLQRHLDWHLVAEQERMKAERKRKDEWEKKLELMMEAQKTEKDAVEN